MTDREKAFFVLAECKHDISKAGNACHYFNISIDLVKQCREELIKNHVSWINETGNRS